MTIKTFLVLALILDISSPFCFAKFNKQTLKKIKTENPIQSQHCKIKDQQLVREKAIKEYKNNKKPKLAAELIESYLNGCSWNKTKAVDYRMLSDLTLYLLKSGQFEKCVTNWSFLTHPNGRAIFESEDEFEQISNSIDFNIEACKRNFINSFGQFDRTRCSEHEGDGLSLKLPKELTEDKNEMCLSYEQLPNTEESCRSLVLNKIGKSSKIGQSANQNINAEESILRSEPNCCKIDEMAWVKKNAKYYLYVHAAGGRDCNGGTADTENLGLYELIKTPETKLKVFTEVEIVYN